MGRSGILNAECYTPPEYRFTPCLSTPILGQAPRHGSTEVTMEATLTGPILYLLIAWGIVTAIFLALLLWRRILTTHEDDQLCIDPAGAPISQEPPPLVSETHQPPNAAQ